MDHLNEPNLHKPFPRSQHQCNWIVKPILSPGLMLVGYVQCPQPVWAAFNVPFGPMAVEAGWYCAQHFFVMIESTSTHKNRT